MAHIVTDRVLETTTTTGTGAIALGGAVTQFQDFDSQMANTDTTVYFIKGISGSSTTEWEVGLRDVEHGQHSHPHHRRQKLEQQRGRQPVGGYEADRDDVHPHRQTTGHGVHHGDHPRSVRRRRPRLMRRCPGLTFS